MTYNGSLFNECILQKDFVFYKQSPYRIANGTVTDIFTNLNGHYHANILVDKQYQNLIRAEFIIFPTIKFHDGCQFCLSLFVIFADITVSFLKSKQAYTFLASLY